MFNLSPDHLPFDIECNTVEELKLAIEAVLEISPVEGPDEFSGEPINLSDLIVKVSPTETPFCRSATPHNVDQAMQDAVIYGTGMYYSTSPNVDIASSLGSGASVADPHLGPWPINGGVEPDQPMPSHSHGVTDYGHECNRPGQTIDAAMLTPEGLRQHSELYRMQMAAISTAALGYHKAGDTIHADFDTPELHDVQALYKKYTVAYELLRRLGFDYQPTSSGGAWAPPPAQPINAEFPADWTALMELMTKHEWKPEHGPIVDVLSEWLDKFVQYAANFNEMEQKRYQAEHEVKVLKAKLQEAEGSNNIAAQQIHNLNDALQKTRGLIAQQQSVKSEEVESLRQSRAEWRTRYKNLRAQVKSAL